MTLQVLIDEPQIESCNVIPTSWASYTAVRRLPSSDRWIGVRRMLFTWALMVDMDEAGYRTRFCYPDEKSAMSALIRWNGNGDPPGPWIKEKGRVERPNPMFKGIQIK